MEIPAELAEVIDFLARHAPFDRLDGRLLAQAARAVEIVYRRRGESVLAIGQANDALAVIRRGAVEVHDGDGQLQFRAAEGESYGLPSLLTGNPVRNRVRTLEDSLIYRLPVAEFRALCAADPGFGQFYVRTLEQRLRGLAPEGAGSELLATPVGRLATRPPVLVEPTASVREAAQAMARAQVSSILVGDGERLAGIVTDRDLRNRVLAAGLDPATPVAAVMTPDPARLDVDQPVFAAHLMMVERGIHHLPLVRAGRPAGMLTTRDLLRLQTQHPLYLVSEVHKQVDLDGLRAVAARSPQMLAALLASGARAEDIARMLAAFADACTRRLLHLVQLRLGPPPCAYAWLALGAHGRGERSPADAQAHALVWAEGPAAGDYFEALARCVCGELAALGFDLDEALPLAAHAGWRRSLAQWQAALADGDAGLLGALADARALAGDAALAAALQEALHQRCAQAPGALAALAREARASEVPLGLFRRFVLAREGEQRDTLDLAASGLAPLAALLRVRALAAGVRETATLARIEALRLGGHLEGELADALAASLRLLLRLRLAQHARQLAVGEAADDRLDPERLDRGDRDALREAFGVIRRAQSGLTDLLA